MRYEADEESGARRTDRTMSAALLKSNKVDCLESDSEFPETRSRVTCEESK